MNGGSADITFQPLDLRPHASEHLDDGILLLAGPSLASALAILSEKLSLRSEPTMVTMVWVAIGYPL